ncbi:SNF2 family protein [Theileria parva strain Muguga]|uniref:SNF2 family protein n=1 Tax=Theileria parva strain Muguga TaxID=333668 RepID=UPI001C6230AE|nr:SNF2 family protein [Theileria parva strain Muguga]EAN31440.2 SNF2 family protein [Theileria parva strain Muguga]
MEEGKNEPVTPTKKKRKLKQRQFSESDDERTESKDEIRIKKQVLLSLESLHSFYQISQNLLGRLLCEMCNEKLMCDVGCVKITRTFGDLAEFKKIDQFHKLKNYQQCGVHWLSIIHKSNLSSAILADEMGLGKTVQVCVFLQYLYNQYNNTITTADSPKDTNHTDTNSPDSTDTPDDDDTVGLRMYIIIVPLNIMYNWYNEFRVWTNIKNILIYHGSQSQRLNTIQYLLNLHHQQSTNRGNSGNTVNSGNRVDGFIVMITTFGMMNDDIRLMRRLQPFEYLIIDEAHLIKNSNSNTYKKLYNCQFNHKLLLTGTPIQNSMDELCNLLQFSMSDVFNSYDINNAIYNIIHNQSLVKSFTQHTHFIQHLNQHNSNSVNNSNIVENVEDGENVENTVENVEDVDGEDVSEDTTGAAGPFTVTEEIKTSINNIIEKNNKKYIISKELRVLQKLTTPFILRRLKKDVINELPVKHSNYIPCQMNTFQSHIYHSSVTTLNSMNSTNNTMNSTNNTMNSTNGINGTGVDIMEGMGDGTEDEIKDSSADTVDNSNTVEDVNTVESVEDVKNTVENVESVENEDAVGPVTVTEMNKIYKLRRICNHPLLVRIIYEDNLIPAIAHLIKKLHPDFSEYNTTKITEYLTTLSDFTIHQLLTQCTTTLDLSVRTKLDVLISRVPEELYFESTKVQKMLEILSNIMERNEKVLIFSQFTNYLDIIQHVLRLREITPVLRLDGTVSLTDRDTIINTFNTDAVSILLISVKVGNVGLNLSVANNVILMDQSWNPYNDIQAEDRCHRIGQQKIVNIYKLFVKDTIEEYIIVKSHNKLHLNSLFNH